MHKRVLMVAVELNDSSHPDDSEFSTRRFGTTGAEVAHLAAWLQAQGVSEVVMESTAQYWKPVWLGLEGHFRLFLAQAWSNRAPRGRKTDFKDAQRLVRRHRAGELTMSFVPDAEQRQMRSLARRRFQLTRDRVRIQNQVESLLEETRIKLSSVISDLFGSSGIRILTQLAKAHADPGFLVTLADARVQCSQTELRDALCGSLGPIHRQLLQQHLDMLKMIESHIEETAKLMADSMRQHALAITRLTGIPGIRVMAAQQLVAEIGPTAAAFASAPQFCSWGGLAPGRNESAGHNHSSHCPKGNMYLRRVLCQVAQAAVRTRNSFFEQKFRRLLPRLGYAKAIWAIARSIAVVVWKILHDGVEYIERGAPSTPAARKRRLQRLRKELRALGFSDELKPLVKEALA